MQATQTALATLDSDILGQLLDLQRDAPMIVARPWIALSQIRMQFFALFARHWAPVATGLGAGLEVFSHLERVPGRRDEHGKVVNSTTSPCDGTTVMDDKSSTHPE